MPFFLGFFVGRVGPRFSWAEVPFSKKTRNPEGFYHKKKARLLESKNRTSPKIEKKEKRGLFFFAKNGAAAHDADGSLTRPRPSVPFGDPKAVFTWDANELARACGRAARVPRRGVRAHARARPLPLGAGRERRGYETHGQPMLVARFPGGHRRADFGPEGPEGPEGLRGLRARAET